MMNPAMEAIAQELCRRPYVDRAGAAVELVTKIDNEFRSRFPNLSAGQRGSAVLQLTHDVIARCIEIDQEAMAARRGRLL